MQVRKKAKRPLQKSAMKNPKKNPNMAVRVIEDETILMPVYQSTKELSYIYTLNKHAAFVWGLINGKRSAVQLQKSVVAKFGGTAEEVGKALSGLLNDLSKIKAIQ